MPKTAAERMRASRDRKRNSATPESATDVTKPERNTPSATVVCRTCGGPVQHPKVVKCLKCCTGGVPSPSVKADAGLPADVQASIEKMCSENNNGARAANHSRAAMTERALNYQAKMGKRPGQGVCGAGCGIEQESGRLDPLDVYSPERWARLQAKGYVFDSEQGIAIAAGTGQIHTAPPVPSDPAYQGVAV